MLKKGDLVNYLGDFGIVISKTGSDWLGELELCYVLVNGRIIMCTKKRLKKL